MFQTEAVGTFWRDHVDSIRIIILKAGSFHGQAHGFPPTKEHLWQLGVLMLQGRGLSRMTVRRPCDTLILGRTLSVRFFLLSSLHSPCAVSAQSIHLLDSGADAPVAD